MCKKTIIRILLILFFLIINILPSFSQSDYTFIPGSPKPSFSNALNGIKSYNFDGFSNGERIKNGDMLFIDAYFLEQLKLWASNVLPNARFGTDYNYPRLSYVRIIAAYNWFDQLRRDGAWEYYARDINIYIVLGGDPNYQHRFVYSFNIPSFHVIANNFNDNTLYRLLLAHVDNYKHNFNDAYLLKLPKYMTEWRENSLRSYFASSKDPIEGIYENTTVEKGNKNRYKLAVKKMPSGNYDLIYLRGVGYYDDWSEGEIKALLNPTGSSATFKAEWVMLDKSINKDCYVYFYSDGKMQVKLPEELSLYQKTFPFSGNSSTNRNTFGQ